MKTLAESLVEISSSVPMDDEDRATLHAAAGEIGRLNDVISDGAKWTPITERLPARVTDEQDAGREVLIVVEKFDGTRYVTCEYVNELLDIVEHCKAEDEACAYTHWTPLPGAPK